MASTALRVPVITQAELDSFHDTHFGSAGIEHFSTNFLPAHDAQHIEHASHFHQDEVYEDDEQEDDGLGYYEDGMKRTLTDEQIAMFRHSELEALRRSQESATLKPATSSAAATITEVPNDTEAAEPGELQSEDNLPSEAVKSAGKRRKRRRTKARVEPEKPDLRKRTWDVVDTGLASLDYGDEPQESSAAPRPAQRRHISYDD
ncbi:hypothetical protein CONLIGDRAFT_125526 [Coniochaeta ligniaria NRRL 30616]|uniref:Uncharacterized protein n=1 Tax=Coniochaeta ligniaria NRRL 30616 TaxID=1408157 RepID=A0A1J7J4M4_9PEZI|nr:hypothetical protein CONLIGDRAFT_125526 [Coniochaeta ligniaria NRRL 30616]